ncbi:ribonuclease G [Chromatiales bacterium (ex Bugula neritina AB1)]|nr:ribonuclease G [Chromatiales bacterium (ex Bugula neritina AB1)]
MLEEILINVTPQETRVATVENGVLNEMCIERRAKKTLVGNIFMGRVARVLPGMEAAFIDIGLDRAAFLHASDIAGSTSIDENGEKQQRHIRELLREEQNILVQVLKNPLGSKGARLTTSLTAPSRYLVYMPGETSLGVSAKIEDEEERERLREIVRKFQQDDDANSGYIVRTAAEGVKEEEIADEMVFLRKLWLSIEAAISSAQPGDRVHADLPLVKRTLRDLVGESVERIRIDSRESYQSACEFAEKYLPEILPRIEHYPGERPIFDLYGVEDEIQKALERKVQLKSGGHLVFDQTESMTTVDVNTGAFVGHRNLEETIFKTNLEAAQAICRQLRLRNLGGIIIIDFIDMSIEEHKRQVMRAMEKALDRDRAKTQVCEVSSLGLVEMTRKRTRESLEQTLCSECPTCSGRGLLRTAETVCYEISREIIRQVRQFDVKSLTVVASPDVVDMFLDEQSDYFAELESFVEVPIRLQPESMYNRDQYDVVIV